MKPLISCIMPTADRREFIPGAIACFKAQTWPHKELIILDDGEDKVGDLIPQDSRILYFPDSEKRKVGAKRNALCWMAAGEYIAHWDSDDWSHPVRLIEQYKLLIRSQVGFVGYRSMYFLDEAKSEAWVYMAEGQYAIGTSFFYRKDYWRAHKFADKNVGEDNEFVLSAKRGGLIAVDANNRMVARIHPGNTSPKLVGGDQWRPADLEYVGRVIAGEV